MSDPIFAAIEAHRAAHAQIKNPRLSELDAADTPEADAEVERMLEPDIDAAGALADCKPTTVAGAVALLRYVAELGCEDEANGWVWEHDDGVDRPLSWFVMNASQSSWANGTYVSSHAS